MINLHDSRKNPLIKLQFANETIIINKCFIENQLIRRISRWFIEMS